MQQGKLLGRIPGVGKLRMNILDSETSRECKEYMMQVHRVGNLQEEFSPPQHIMDALMLTGHANLGVHAIPNGFVVTKTNAQNIPVLHPPATTRAVMAVVHAPDIGNSEPDDDSQMCSWRVKYRDADSVLHMETTGENFSHIPEFIPVRSTMKCNDIIGPLKRALEPCEDSDDEMHDVDNSTALAYGESGSDGSSCSDEDSASEDGSEMFHEPALTSEAFFGEEEGSDEDEDGGEAGPALTSEAFVGEEEGSSDEDEDGGAAGPALTSEAFVGEEEGSDEDEDGGTAQTSRAFADTASSGSRYSKEQQDFIKAEFDRMAMQAAASAEHAGDMEDSDHEGSIASSGSEASVFAEFNLVGRR